MITKTNHGLVEWSRTHLGLGYVYGTFFSALITEYLLQQKAAQFPKKYTADYLRRSRRWIGKNAGDCVGLIKGYYWHDPVTNKVIYKLDGRPDYSADGMFKAAQEMGGRTASQNLGITWGYLENTPEIPGLLVWRTGHIGVYVGNKKVIESRGVDYGVVETDISNRGWMRWCKCPYISYDPALPTPLPIEEGEKMNPYNEPTKTYPAGRLFTGNDARWFIFELIKRGHNLISNSDQAGPNTWAAIYKEQEKAGVPIGDATELTRMALKGQIGSSALVLENARLKSENEALKKKVSNAVAELLK